MVLFDLVEDSVVSDSERVYSFLFSAEGLSSLRVGSENVCFFEYSDMDLAASVFMFLRKRGA
jgi:hypothetical protein